MTVKLESAVASVILKVTGDHDRSLDAQSAQLDDRFLGLGSDRVGDTEDAPDIPPDATTTAVLPSDCILSISAFSWGSTMPL
jgi:hypothetical protein